MIHNLQAKDQRRKRTNLKKARSNLRVKMSLRMKKKQSKMMKLINTINLVKLLAIRIIMPILETIITEERPFR